MAISFRRVTEKDLDRCYEIETTSYAGDEAASKKKILTRIKNYPEGFILVENTREIIGFINCGATFKVELSDEEFKELKGHNSAGPYVVIMSVVVHPDYQRKGYAGKLLSFFIDVMRKEDKTEIHLICQTELIHMYSKYGFKNLGKSSSDHGGLSWNEMKLLLNA